MNKQEKNNTIKAMKSTITEAFERCAINERKALFKELKNWAKTTHELSKEASELFIKALYECKATQGAQLECAIDNALTRIKGAK